MGAQCSSQLVHIAGLISDDPIAGQDVDGKRHPLANGATLKAIQTFWEGVPKQWKTFLNSPCNVILQRLTAPDRPPVQQLEEHVMRMVWGWAENPEGFHNIDGDVCLPTASQPAIARPLDGFIQSIVRLKERRLIDDIRWRIWTVCFSRVIKKLLPPGSRLPTRKDEVVAIFRSSGLVSETILDASFKHFQEFLHAGRVYDRIMEECSSEGALIYIPQLTRLVWDTYMPLKADYAAAVLGPIRDAVQKKSTEVWGSEGIQVRSANEVVKVLLGHFLGLLEGGRAFVPWENGGTHRRRQRQGDCRASKQPRNQTNREPRIPTGNRQRVRKPATLTAEQTATRSTHCRRLTPVPQREQSPTGGSSHQNGGGQEIVVIDRNGTVNRIAMELGPSNEYLPVQSSGQDNEYAAQGSSSPGPMNGVASGSRNGILNGQPHTANGFPQDGQGVPGIFNEASNRLTPISPIIRQQQLPPITFVTSGTPRTEDRGVRVLDNTSGSWSGFTNSTPSNNETGGHDARPFENRFERVNWNSGVSGNASSSSSHGGFATPNLRPNNQPMMTPYSPTCPSTSAPLSAGTSAFHVHTDPIQNYPTLKQ
ncbi:hypothetical protein LOZ65_006909, partial [Ophidiomyces ophidiicola]